MYFSCQLPITQTTKEMNKKLDNHNQVFSKIFMVFYLILEIGSNSIVGGRGRGRVFNTAGSGQSRDNGWNGQSRTRPRSDNDYDWRKPGNGDQSPPNGDESWANQSANGSVSPNQQSTQGGGAADTWGNNKKNPQNRNGTYWNKGES